MTEYNLSEKIGHCRWWPNCNKECETITVKDVKEFMIQEKALLILVRDGKISWYEFFQRRDKLAGEKLNGKTK